MRTPRFLKEASNAGFWSHSVDQIHTLVLRQGVLISAKEIDDEVSRARAASFVFTPVTITGVKVADIIICWHRNIKMVSCFK